jgi:hypothetical protein
MLVQISLFPRIDPRRSAMNQNDHPVDDTACPAAFIAIPAVVGALIWLWVMLLSLPHY